MTEFFTLSLTLNGDSHPFATQSLNTKNGDTDTMRAITAWLDVGTHTITIFHHNYDAGLRLRLDSVSIQRLGGADLNSDGVPDWVEGKATLGNSITRIATASRTSPASIEGITQQLSTASASVLAPGASQADPVALSRSINNSFFADLPLNETGPVKH